MAISGNKRTPLPDFVKRMVGLAVCEVVLINPSKVELEELLGKELEKDPVYFKKDDEGNPALTLEIWIKEIKTSQLFKLRMRTLTDKVLQIPDGKVRFVDSKGNTSYFLDNETNLVDWMQANSPRRAREGEVELYKFLRAHQGELKPKEIEDFTIDWSKLMSGDVTEIREMKNSGFASNILAVLCVRIDKKDGSIKQYQNVFNQTFLPGDYMRYFRVAGKNMPPPATHFINEVTNPKHGCLDFFGIGRKLREMHEYVPSENPLESDDAVLPAGDQTTPVAEFEDAVEMSTDY